MSRKRITLLDQRVELLPALEHRLDRLMLRLVSDCRRSRAEQKIDTHQNDLRLVELLLDLHDRVRLPRVLILDEVVVDLSKVDACRLGLRCRSRAVGGRLPLLARHTGDKVVEQLVEQRERRPDRVLVCWVSRIRATINSPSVTITPVMESGATRE